MQFRVTTLRYRPKEAVPIEPKQQRHISTDGVKTTAGATGQPGAPAPKNKKKPKKRRSIIGMIFSFIGCMLCLCIMAASVGGVLLSMYIVQVTADDAETLDLDNQKNRQTSIVYDINGNEYASLSRNENRIWRELSAMPENLQNAVIAIEDKNFRTEPGINLKGTIGAALNAFTGNRIWGTNRGASTLEQQLIKNLTGDNEQDNMRKVREIFRALGLDNKYSKETILEAYLNTIPLTGIIHGMEAGSIEYFGKHVEDLTLAECATLASITKNPTKYNPATNPEELIKRRNHVLYEMYTQGYITEAEFNAAKAETVTLTEKTSTTENATRSSSNSWFTDALYTQLLSQLQEDLNYTADEAKELIFSGGLRIYSTVDPTVQAGIEKTMYNEDDLIPALWHEEPVCLRDYPADSSSWDEVQYDEATGLPITKDGYAVYGQEAIPVYADDEGTTLKTGTSTDPDYPNDTTEYLCVYEKVRTQAAMATLDHYCERVREADAAKAALEAKVKSLAQQPRWKPTCDALKCLKGIDAVTAASIACEADGFARFATASGFAAWVGLVPSEHSSGESRFRGGITKAGNKHLRKLLVEAAWHYKGASRSPKDLAKGQVVDAATRRHANAGVRRLVDRRRSMDDAGKQSSVANVAVARELACWCWAVGRMAEGA